jgi:beta-mannanase
MKAYRYKLFLNIYHEPEDNVIPTAGSGMTAADYAAMYRRVVTKLREAGVTNAVYVWNTMGFYGWRQYLDDLYPGNEYVDWLAYDPYITNDTAVDLHGMINFTFRGMPDWPGYYAWVTAKAPGKPVMLAEWGVDLRTNADPSSKLNVDVNEIVRRYPMLKAMVYWNDRNDHHVDVRIDDPSAKGVAYGAAYRRLAAHPVFNAMTPDSAP